MGREISLVQVFRQLDYVGILILCGSLASLILGITWGSTTYLWISGQVVATIVCGSIGLGIFGVWEWLGKDDGIFDHRLMQTTNFPILMLNCVIDGMLRLGVSILYAQHCGSLHQ
jgi:hypothetical protein